MQNTNITTARAELFKLASSCIKYNNVININTKEGNVIMLSEEDYDSIYLIKNKKIGNSNVVLTSLNLESNG